ncbi:MAG: hypothetical protein BWK76_12275 [Desulfobulbaceae bacterium A2]|nr:MAG: hypothetical protein BWK76_12275 [Desulfobulbaceae bacterium A2]
MADSVFNTKVQSGTLIDPLGLGKTATTKNAGTSAATAFANLLSARMQASQTAANARKNTVVRSVVTPTTFPTATTPISSISTAALPELGTVQVRQTEIIPESATEQDSASGATTATVATESTDAATPSAKAAAPNFDAIMQTIFRHEGSRYVGSDAGGEASKYGILQSTAKENGFVGDLRSMTQTQAKEIYRKIWNKSGAAQMDADLSLVYFDSYINHPASAKRFLKESGGDINTFLQLREARYQELATTKPERFGRYLKGWMNRIASLRSAVGTTPLVADSGEATAADA